VSGSPPLASHPLRSAFLPNVPLHVRNALELLLFALVYGVTAKLGLAYSSLAPNVTLIWPPSGISLFVILRFGYRLWPGVVLGDVIANAGTGAHLLSVLGIATGNLVETLLCAWLLQRCVGFQGSLHRVRDIVALLALGTLCAAPSAFIGPASLAAGGAFGWELYWSVWLQWFMGDATGVIVLTPLLLAWATLRTPPSIPPRLGEACALAVLLGLACVGVFGGLGLFRQGYYPAALAIFPLAVWAALRFGMRGATAVTLLVSMAAIWGTVHGLGPFVDDAGVGSFVRWWVFVNVITVTALVLAASQSERDRAQQQAIRDRDFADAILDAEGALVLVLDAQGRILRVNRAFEALSGWRAADVEGADFKSALIAPEHWPKLEANSELLRLRLSEVVRHEAQLARKAGDRLLVSWSTAVLRNRAGQIEHLIVTGIDVTARAQANDALRKARRELEARVVERTRELAAANAVLHEEILERQRLEGEIINVSENEQKRFGQELHDGLGQHLTATAFLAELLSQKLSGRGLPESEDADRIERMLSQAISHTRQLARGLFPVELETNGLMAALEQLAESTRSVYHLECRFRCPAPVLVADNALAIHLYRVAQEAVNNAVKHSGCGRIDIELTAAGGTVRLRIADDGVGLPVRDVAHQGMGLRIMQYRAKLVGGAIALESAGSGLAVHMAVNLREAGS
jgi:PAS domain S-box-containing protein